MRVYSRGMRREDEKVERKRERERNESSEKKKCEVESFLARGSPRTNVYADKRRRGEERRGRFRDGLSDKGPAKIKPLTVCINTCNMISNLNKRQDAKMQLVYTSHCS